MNDDVPASTPGPRLNRRSLLFAAAAVPLVLGAGRPTPTAQVPASAPSPLPRAAQTAPRATLLRNTVLDPQALFEVTYSGLPNVGSYQQDSVLTRGGHQYTAWYRADRKVVVARRTVTGSTPGSWQNIVLGHALSVRDSHNTISLGVSAHDGRLHIAMDTHNSRVFYLRSAAGLVGGTVPWATSSFSAVQRTLEGAELGGITYPQFVDTPDGGLLLSYRTGGSGGGRNELARYGTDRRWTVLGAWSGEGGVYRTQYGSSDTRNMYLHGIGFGPGNRLHASFTWREDAGGGAVLCNPGGLSNHDTGYVYSDDEGRTWRTQDGVVAARTGTDTLVTVATPNHVVDPLGPDQALINQESQAVDSAGRPHVIISYVPGRFTRCVTNFTTERIANAYPFHLVKLASGWRKIELPQKTGKFGRTQIALGPNDDAYAVLPSGRVLSASAATEWTDWAVAFDGSGVSSFSECTLDRSRARDGLLSVLYQEPSSGTTPSALRVVDLRLGG